MSAERWSRETGLTLNNIAGTASDNDHAHAPPESPVCSHQLAPPPPPALELHSWTGNHRHSNSSISKLSVDTSLPPMQRASSTSFHSLNHHHEQETSEECLSRQDWGAGTGGGGNRGPGHNEDNIPQDESLRVPPGVVNVGTHYTLKLVLVPSLKLLNFV
jgi:hypothetical protein